MSPSLSRRRLLAAATALPVDLRAIAEGPASLAAAARLSGRSFGSAVHGEAISRDAAYAAVVARECHGLTPELELKWAAVEPRRGELNLAPMDRLADFARAHGMAVHGHTLVWHRSIPSWAEAALRDAPDWSLIHRYFGSVIPRYGDAISRWDVINEPSDPQGAGGLRASPLLRAFGPDYLRRTLETARLFAPRGQLLINEYGLEYDDAEGQARRKAFLQLIDGLRAAGAPLDGVGLQSHLELARGPIAQESLRSFLRELAARRLIICLTELDVKEADDALPAERRDAVVAAAAEAFLDAALDTPEVLSVTTWGLSDRYSWLQARGADPRRRPFPWRDNASARLNRGLPLDAALRPKPMYQAMLRAFRTAAAKTGRVSII